MNKKKTARVAGFVGALGTSALLLGAAANTTGAYFTDSHDGTLQATRGHLTVTTSDLYLNFADLVPGEYQDKQIDYTTNSSTTEDIWLQFVPGTGYGALTGAADGSDGVAGGGMGRFGHFAVQDNAGNVLFSSYNLTNVSHNTSGCADSDGHGSGPQATSPTDTPPNCGVPQFIKVESGLPSGANRHMTLTFGITGRATGQNTQQANAPFKVIATQHGVRPDAQNF